jgi:hypothetical protein
MHGWLENPNDMAYAQQIIPDYLQEMGHPSENLFNWYYNKGVPAVQNTPYLDANDARFDHLTAGLYTINDANRKKLNSDAQTPLTSASLIRGLNLPPLKGTLLNAVRRVYGENSRIAQFFHQNLLAKELQAIGLFNDRDMMNVNLNQPIHPEAIRGLNYLTDPRTMAGGGIINYINTVSRGHFDTANEPEEPRDLPLRVDGNEEPTEVSNRRMLATTGNAARNFGNSMMWDSNLPDLKKQPYKMSKLQFGQHAPAGSGAVA